MKEANEEVTQIYSYIGEVTQISGYLARVSVSLNSLVHSIHLHLLGYSDSNSILAWSTTWSRCN